MTRLYEIDLAGQPRQQFSYSINAQRVDFIFLYNVHLDRYSVTIRINDTLRVSGRLLVSDTDILAGFGDLGLANARLFCVDVNKAGRPPNISNISDGLIRIFIKTDEDML